MKTNIILPIAGHGQRFIDGGYATPKPLIEVDGKYLVEKSMESINTENANLIFVVRQEHIDAFNIDEKLKDRFGEDIQIISVDYTTDGAICTCLLAEELVDNDSPLAIFTPDCYFEPHIDVNDIDEKYDGLVCVFESQSDAHSYVKLNEDGFVTEAKEKEVISNNAVGGFYYFRTGKMFVEYAEEMISKNIRTKNEFYICPMYNLMIRDGCKVGIHMVDKMHVLGTPAELEFFVDHVTARFGEKPVALCCDHSGFHMKELAKKLLDKNDVPYIDFGTYVKKDCDYNEYVIAAVGSMRNKVSDFTMGFCRTGQGVNILANHLEGVRSALVIDEYTAEYAIRHNCVNFLAVPEKYVSEDMLDRMIKIWKETTFDGGRHMTRMKKTMG